MHARDAQLVQRRQVGQRHAASRCGDGKRFQAAGADERQRRGRIDHVVDLAGNERGLRRRRAFVRNVHGVDAGRGVEHDAEQMLRRTTPPEPKLSLPGFALAIATSSFGELAGELASTTRKLGTM